MNVFVHLVRPCKALHKSVYEVNDLSLVFSTEEVDPHAKRSGCGCPRHKTEHYPLVGVPKHWFPSTVEGKELNSWNIGRASWNTKPPVIKAFFDSMIPEKALRSAWIEVVKTKEQIHSLGFGLKDANE